jgi:gluconolactonase
MERLAHGYGLVEGPVYSPEHGLIFSDVLGGGVFAVNDAGQVRTVFEHRRGIGGMSLHQADGSEPASGLIVSGRNISYKPFDGGPTLTVLDRDPDAGNVGYNDITADAAGRIYAGSLGSSPVFEDGREPAAGSLHLINLDGSSQVVAEGISLTNGLAFSPDSATLYHGDSRVQTVWRYDVRADGTLSEKTVFAKTETGSPDGLAVAEDGSVWVALAGGGRVSVFAADGSERASIPVSQPMVTSVCFGGADLRQLYIVTGSDGAEGDRVGSVFVEPVDVAGLPVAVARVQLPAAPDG